MKSVTQTESFWINVFVFLSQTLNKNNLIPDDRTNFYPLQQTNVYTTTYYPSTLNKYDYRPEASPGRTFTNSWWWTDSPRTGWPPIWFLFFKIEFMDQILAHSLDVNIIQWAFYFIVYQWDLLFEQRISLSWPTVEGLSCLGILRGPQLEVALYCCGHLWPTVILSWRVPTLSRCQRCLGTNYSFAKLVWNGI